MDIGDNISVTREAGPARDGVLVWHDYFEQVYASTCGPTAVLALRVLNRVAADADGEPVNVRLDEVATEVCVASRHVRRAIGTLVEHKLARIGENGQLIVPIHVPVVAEAVAARLPPLAADAHHRYVRAAAILALRSHTDARRTDIAERLAGPHRPPLGR